MNKLVVLLILAATTSLAQTPRMQFSGDSAYAALRILASEIGPRPMGSPAEQRALAFAAAEFARHGCDTSYVMPMTDANGVNTRSGVAVGVHRGRTGRIIVIGGHIDSDSPENAGANDDGSGAASVIELARVFGRRETNSTILFCCWGGEEEGLRGSTYFVDHFPEIDSVDLMLQIDMADGAGSLEADPDASFQQSAPPWLVRAAFDIFYDELQFEGLRYSTQYMTMNYAGRGGSGSDHMPFIERGIPAIDFTSDLDYPIHTPLDNLAMFDSSGLRRSGLLVQRLAERFDGGVPSRETERYWLLNSHRWLAFVSHGTLQFVVGLAVALAFAGLAGRWWLRRRRNAPTATAMQESMAVVSVPSGPDAVPTLAPGETPAYPGIAEEAPAPGARAHARHVRWSGLKILAATVLIQAFVWLSSTVLGGITGVRFPWVNNVGGFVILHLLAGLLGLWASLLFLSRFRVSPDPLPLYLRAVLLLLLFTVPLSLLSIELAVYPALSLLLVGLALLARPTWLKTLFALMAPVMLLSLLFIEPLMFLLRTLTVPYGGTAISRTFVDLFLISLFSIVTLPFMYTFAAVCREVPAAVAAARRFRTWPVFGLLAAASLLLGFYLAGRPTYDARWQKAVRLEQRHDAGKDSSHVRIVGGEYLDGLQLTYDGRDTVLGGHLQWAGFPLLGSQGRVPWCEISATEGERLPDDGKRGDLSLVRTLTIRSVIRPLSISVVYHSSGSVNVESPWVRGRRGRMPSMSDTLQSFTWYAFPDTLLRIPVTFHLRGNQTVQEEVEVVYDSLAAPLAPRRPLTFNTARTIVRHRARFGAEAAAVDQLAEGGR